MVGDQAVLGRLRRRQPFTRVEQVFLDLELLAAVGCGARAATAERTPEPGQTFPLNTMMTDPDADDQIPPKVGALAPLESAARPPSRSEAGGLTGPIREPPGTLPMPPRRLCAITSREVGWPSGVDLRRPEAHACFRFPRTPRRLAPSGVQIGSASAIRVNRRAQAIWPIRKLESRKNSFGAW